MTHLDEIRSILATYPEVNARERTKVLDFYGSASYADLIAIISDPFLERKLRVLRADQPEHSGSSPGLGLQVSATLAAGVLLLLILLL